MSHSRHIHRSAPLRTPRRCSHSNPRLQQPTPETGRTLLSSRAGVTFTPDSSSLEPTRLTQPGLRSPPPLCFAPLFDSFQLCLAHSYCNGLHSGGSMCSLFCCQGLRWMEGAAGSTGGEVKEGRVVGRPNPSPPPRPPTSRSVEPSRFF